MQYYSPQVNPHDPRTVAAALQCAFFPSELRRVAASKDPQAKLSIRLEGIPPGGGDLQTIAFDFVASKSTDWLSLIFRARAFVRENYPGSDFTAQLTDLRSKAVIPLIP